LTETIPSRLQARLEALYGLERRKDKLGLDGTRALLGALGDPQRRFRSVHVAGTNGKGSVCAMVERVLREAGVRTGLFTSPHLVDFRERIRVNGRWADAEWLDAALDRIAALPEGRDRTFFEVVTALGFLYFAERGVEWAVVEVGLGGRLDTTNVLEPDVCAITSIGFDHTEILGDTLEMIAAEKAGIIKPGVPVVASSQVPEVARVLEETATRVRAPLRLDVAPHGAEARALLDRLRESPWGPITFDPSTYAVRTAQNTITALEVLRVLHEGPMSLSSGAVERGLAAARWPGRFERCPSLPRLWWDGAHNLPGFQAQARAWGDHRIHEELRTGGECPDFAVIVLALARDKDAAGILGRLRSAYPGARLVVTRTRSERAREPGDLAELADARGFLVRAAPDVRSAVLAALDWVPDGPVMLTGSLFAVGEAMEAFGGAPGEEL